MVTVEVVVMAKHSQCRRGRHDWRIFESPEGEKLPEVRPLRRGLPARLRVRKPRASSQGLEGLRDAWVGAAMR
jgi:hypothetical protein